MPEKRGQAGQTTGRGERSQSEFELEALCCISRKREDNKGKRNMTEAAASAVILDKETGRGGKRGKEGREQEAEKANERKTEHVR